MNTLNSGWRSLAMVALLAGILTPFAGMAAGLKPVPEEKTWIANGPVRATVATPGAVYLGGQFTQVGPRTGCGVPVDATTGQPVATYPQVDCGAGGSVDASISDGSGGWFIGGDFFQIDGLPISGIAHIKADGTVDETWVVEMNYGPYAMALSPDGTILYLGGLFTQVEGETRAHLAAVNAATGALLAWDPDSDGEVYALAVSGDGATVYAGGYFSQAGGQASQNLVAIDAATGAGTAIVASPDELVRSMALSADGLTLYVGGDFNLLVGAFPVHGIAAIDTATGMPDLGWNPNAAGTVNDLILDEANGVIYLGGSFSSVHGEVRNRLAAVDLVSGTPTVWDPDADNSVYALSVSPDGATIYAGGAFRMMGGEIRTRLAAIDTATGEPTAWNPIAANTVSTLAAAGSTVYVGGNFQSLGGCLRNSLAAIDPVTGRAMAFNPGPDNPGGTDEIYALAIAPDHQTLYVGGNFQYFGGETRNDLAALDATTGLATAWNVDVGGRVRALAMSSDGQTLYLGGEFNTVGVEARNGLAAVDTVTGLPAAWDADANDAVLSLALSHDGTKLFAGGWFTTIGGQSRLGLALLDPATGLADADWQADTSLEGIAGGWVYSLAITSDDATLYVGGIFDGIGSVSRDDLAALNALSAGVLPWNPLADDQVSAMVLSDDDATLYVGGQFSSIGGADRDNLATLDTTSGTALSWDPRPDSSVEALALGPGGASLFVGGYFLHWGADFHLGKGFAQFNDPDLMANLVVAVTPPGAGSTSPAAGTYEVITDVAIPIVATAAAGQIFIEWTVVGPGLVADADAASTTLTLTAPSAVTVTANFAPTAPLVIGVNPADSGTTIPAEGTYTVVVGVPQAVSATPTVGWHFTDWSLDAGNADIADTMTAATTITVTDVGGATIAANFEINRYTVTFETDGTPGATIDGGTVVTKLVNHGSDSTAVTAAAPGGAVFVNWTLAGELYASTATVVAANVIGDLTLVANFAPIGQTATLTLAAGANGTTQPTPDAYTVEIDQGVGIVAVPDFGYEFFGWQVTTGNATLGDALSAATTVTVADAGGATVTARFGQHAVLTVMANPAEGGTVTPALPLTVVVGEGVDISATANFGYGFLGWEIADGNAELASASSGSTTMTVTAVGGATLLANFAELDRLAAGSVFEVAAADVGLAGDFTLKPKVYGQYDHPLIVGKLGLKATAKVLTKVVKTGTDPLDCEWTKKIKLYDAKAFKAAQKGGESAETWIAANQEDLPVVLHAASKEIPDGDQPLRSVLLAAPEILTATVGAAEGVTTVTLEGNWFGTKKPKVWREYEVDDGAGGVIVKQQTMKVVKPTVDNTTYLDSKLKPSYMDAETGEGKVIVIVPAKEPKGTLSGVLVLENGVGMATEALP